MEKNLVDKIDKMIQECISDANKEGKLFYELDTIPPSQIRLIYGPLPISNIKGGLFWGVAETIAKKSGINLDLADFNLRKAGKHLEVDLKPVFYVDLSTEKINKKIIKEKIERLMKASEKLSKKLNNFAERLMEKL